MENMLRQGRILVILVYSCFVLINAVNNRRIEKEEGEGSANPIPVVLWHGMNDSCCDPLKMGWIKQTIETQVPGIFVYSVEVGNSTFDDYIHGFISNVDTDISQICRILAGIPELRNGYHAMGFSQGSQFLRAVTQRCPNPPMRNLITFGGQHQGVFGIPNCDPRNASCDLLRRIATPLVYEKQMQEYFVQGQYWHDPIDHQNYQENNIFMTDINNENTINEFYRTNLKNLWNFVMVKFNRDTIVIPRESEWFGFYNDGQATEVHTLEESALYIEDRLGLKQMDQEGRLIKYSINTEHVVIPQQDLINIINLYIINNGSQPQ